MAIQAVDKERAVDSMDRVRAAMQRYQSPRRDGVNGRHP